MHATSANGAAAAAQVTAGAGGVPDSNGRASHRDPERLTAQGIPYGGASSEYTAHADSMPPQPEAQLTRDSGGMAAVGILGNMAPAKADQHANGRSPPVRTGGGAGLNEEASAAAEAVVKPKPAATSPFTAARATKEADPRSARAYSVIAAAHASSQLQASGWDPET